MTERTCDYHFLHTYRGDITRYYICTRPLMHRGLHKGDEMSKPDWDLAREAVERAYREREAQRLGRD